MDRETAEGNVVRLRNGLPISSQSTDRGAVETPRTPERKYRAVVPLIKTPAPAGEVAIKVTNLVKDFADFRAVDHISFAVKKGEIYGLLGPNGSGKTTTIKVLCGLLRSSLGEAYVLGTRVSDSRAASRIGYMPQELAMYRGLTVHENLVFYGEVFGLSKQQIDAREQALLKLVDLQDWKDALVDNLSGGMQHRISLACALLHEPKLLFLDEPTIGVDPELRASFWRYFEQLREDGITILITTHYMDEARNCDRIGFMREGRLIAEGSPQELLEMTHTDSLEEAFLSYGQAGRSQ
jgi:ABC-2 type transport system ATP-binding protein